MVKEFHNNFDQLHLICLIWVFLYLYICFDTTVLYSCKERNRLSRLRIPLQAIFNVYQSYFQKIINSILQSITKVSFFQYTNNSCHVYMSIILAPSSAAPSRQSVMKKQSSHSWHISWLTAAYLHRAMTVKCVMEHDSRCSHYLKLVAYICSNMIHAKNRQKLI